MNDININQDVIVKIVKPNTMVSRGRIYDLNRLVNETIELAVEGDFVECGVYRGGLSALMLDKILSNQIDKKLWIYDTFQGMSEPTEVDISTKNENAVDAFNTLKNEITGYADWCKATINIVESTLNLVSSDYKNYCHLIQGKVEDTLQIIDNLPKRISLMRLDTDWYESTKIELETFYNMLSAGGIIIIDDYRYWQGQKLAVDEFFDKIEKGSYDFRDGDDGSLIIKKYR